MAEKPQLPLGVLLAGALQDRGQIETVKLTTLVAITTKLDAIEAILKAMLAELQEANERARKP